mmetsp:Transcript_1955/g.4445  ORF Transcript_1955/g.4445 Transcript_1955/m.4445 type:complete len:106 (+) Transcript_1955:452-769(+)
MCTTLTTRPDPRDSPRAARADGGLCATSEEYNCTEQTLRHCLQQRTLFDSTRVRFFLYLDPGHDSPSGIVKLAAIWYGLQLSRPLRFDPLIPSAATSALGRSLLL